MVWYYVYVVSYVLKSLFFSVAWEEGNGSEGARMGVKAGEEVEPSKREGTYTHT